MFVLYPFAEYTKSVIDLRPEEPGALGDRSKSVPGLNAEMVRRSRVVGWFPAGRRSWSRMVEDRGVGVGISDSSVFLLSNSDFTAQITRTSHARGVLT